LIRIAVLALLLLLLDDWMQLPFAQTALAAIQDALSLR